MKKTNALALSLSLAAALIIGAVYSWLREDRAAPVPAISHDTTAPSARSQPDLDAATATRMLPPPISAPLPPADARVADIYDELKKRADRGDSHAACRLAMDLIDCRRLGLMPAPEVYGTPNDMESALEREGNLDGANGIAAAQLRLLHERRRCEGVSAAQTQQGFHYLRQAARAGVNDALVTYSDGVGFPDGPFAILRDPAFDAWRREAPAMMERALRQGEPSAVTMLYAAYSGDYSFFSGLIEDDPAQTYRYLLLMAKMRGRPSPTPPAGLNADEIAQADIAASRMHRDYFDAAILESRAAFSPPYMQAYHDASGESRPQRCE